MIPQNILLHARPGGTAAPNTDEWLLERRRGIGASDCPAILGLSRYGDARKVWGAKIGETEKDQPWLEPYRQSGHLLEKAIIRSTYRELDFEPVYDLPTLQSIYHEELFCTLDAYDPVGNFNIEVKTDRWDDLEIVPDCHWAQCQHQMIVTGSDRCSLLHFVSPVDRSILPDLYEQWINDPEDKFFDWLIDAGSLRTHMIDADKEWQARWIVRSQEWWLRHVVNHREPPTREELEGTVDLSTSEEVQAALNLYALEDAEYKRRAKPIEDRREAAKKRARSVIERYAPLDADAPKRVTVGNHKATACKTRGGGYYWRLYPGDVDFDI